MFEKLGANASLRFPAELVNDPARAPKLYVRLPATWARGADWTRLCVAVVPRPEFCEEQAFVGACTSRALPSWTQMDDHLSFEVQRPAFTMGFDKGEDGENHSVCVSSHHQRPLVAGQLLYYAKPTIKFLRQHVRIGVRSFLNPGWRADIALECQNCSSMSRLAIEPAPTGACKPKARLARDVLCPPPPGGPCLGEPLTLGELKPGQVNEEGHVKGGRAIFTLQSTQRLSAKQRKAYFHHQGQLCFYPDPSTPRGWLAGYVELRTDGPDVQAFVGFVCFFGIALPLICMLTLLLHINKRQRCSRHVAELSLQFQRDHLSQELARSTSGEANAESLTWALARRPDFSSG